MIQIYETGHVKGPDDIFVSPDVKIKFGKLSDSELRGHFVSLTSTISLGFVSASGTHVPIPEGIRVTSGGQQLESWTPDFFLLIIDRAYSIWLSDTLLFETHPAIHEIKVPISRAVASLSPLLQRMMTGSE